MENIHFRDQTGLETKIENIRQAGIDSLQIVSDFDRTLTKCFVNGEYIPSAIALIRQGNYLSDTYVEKAYALSREYYPIEIDHSLSYDFRFQKMQEWWEKHLALLIESGMNQGVIDDMLAQSRKMLRDGASDFFDFLHSRDIPLLIFSAGIGNIIEGILNQTGKITPNVQILSNTFVFDTDGHATGIENEPIHVMNKSTARISEQYKNIVSTRKNVILLGDSLGDLDMVDDHDVHEIIRIGFLNENIEENLDLFTSKFDVVISGDGSFEYVNDLLEQIARK